MYYIQTIVVLLFFYNLIGYPIIWLFKLPQKDLSTIL